MATISSNNLGLYAFNTTQTTPLEVLDTATVIGSVLNSAAPDGVAVSDHFLVVNDGAFVAVAQRGATDTDPVTDVTNSLTLMALATSTSLEAQNSVTETAARNGSGGSTNFIVSGAMTWSTSIEGLLDVAAAAGSAITVMDAAREKQYLIAKFDIDEGSAHTFYAGQTLIDSVSISGGVDDIATYSASLSGYGDLYKG